MTEGLSASARLAAAYAVLVESAKDLNAASDELSKPIAEIDAVLKQLNLGLTVWEKIHGVDDDYRGNFWSRDVGYSKVKGTWGISIRTTEGNHNDPEDDDVEEWLFNDAPRSLRIDAIEKIPDLVEKLIKASDKTTKKLKETAVHARELATTLTMTATQLRAQQKKAAEQKKASR